MAKATIIGAGVIGLYSAYYLQKAGYEVTIIDRGNLTDGCSFGNMGYMSPSHFTPLASPGIIAEGLKYMLNSSSPFYIKPRLSWPMMQWASHFYRSSSATTAVRNAPHLNNLLQLSRHLVENVKDDIGDTFSLETIGCLMMCKSTRTLEHEHQVADQAEKFGLHVDRLTRAAVQDLEPDVEVDVAGAVLFKDDCHLHPGRMIAALQTYLLKQGVHFEMNSNVMDFEESAGRVTAVLSDNRKFLCDELVIAAGSWLPGLLKLLEVKLLLQAGKGYSYTYPSVEKNIRYPAIMVDGRCAITPWQHELRIGGTMEFSGINHLIMAKRMNGIYATVKSFYPGLQIPPPTADRTWCGLRPVSPDGLPYIDRAGGFSNVIIAGGHAMLGVSTAPGTGLLVSQLMQHLKPEIEVSAFSSTRF